MGAFVWHGLLGVDAFHEPTEELSNLLVIAANGIDGSPINMITELDQITVAGVTSPDATLSVNGRLISPDSKGSFSIDLDMLVPTPPES